VAVEVDNVASQAEGRRNDGILRSRPYLPLAGVGPRAYLHGMLDWSECPAVERVPGKVSGAWLFKGTRVPVKALFENIESGARVDEFLEWFPGVTRGQVEAVLEHAERSLAVA
jgi:uncharacterized protein (DUF433 family)